MLTVMHAPSSQWWLVSPAPSGNLREDKHHWLVVEFSICFISNRTLFWGHELTFPLSSWYPTVSLPSPASFTINHSLRYFPLNSFLSDVCFILLKSLFWSHSPLKLLYSWHAQSSFYVIVSRIVMVAWLLVNIVRASTSCIDVDHM